MVKSSHCFWEVDLIQQWGCSLDPFFLIPGQNTAKQLQYEIPPEEVKHQETYQTYKHDPNMDAKNMRGWKQNLAMFVKQCEFVYLKKVVVIFCVHHPSSLGPVKHMHPFRNPPAKHNEVGFYWQI